MKVYMASALASQGGSWGKALLWSIVAIAIVSFFTGMDHKLDAIDHANHERLHHD